MILIFGALLAVYVFCRAILPLRLKWGWKALLAVLLAVTALPAAVMAEEKDDKKQLTKVTLNEVAHSIFYAPQYVAIEKGYFADQGLEVELVTGFGADKVLTAVISGVI